MKYIWAYCLQCMQLLLNCNLTIYFQVVSFLPSCTIQGCDGGLESEEFEYTTPATPETLHVLPGLPRDGAYSLPSYSESLLSADDVPQVEAVDTVDAVAHLMASKTLSDKDNIVMREREKLNVLKDLLEVQKKRLQIEEQKFAYITSLHQTGQSELNVSPIIQFL
ncbi:uncharacterized protein LOC124271749 isoform X1 [Haliotis rubra]|uniref:uncharacterized protein LOC124271749 isoform X1 n=1 Tax=Haliotis rubra TaxID=36100 RepID=UPI001EE4FAB4|nr:uncharacterized protein LOC124271749 isoform X1 [Haliotis rubra]